MSVEKGLAKRQGTWTTRTRRALQKLVTSRPPPGKGQSTGRASGTSEADQRVGPARFMAPTPSPLNLIRSPSLSALSVNLQPKKLAPDLIWIPSAQEDPMAYNLLGLTANAYMLLIGKQAVAVDATSPFVTPVLQSILEREQCTLSALLLTHHHIAAAGKPQGRGLERFRGAFPEVPVFLHPTDAEHEEAKLSGVDYCNPLEGKLLDSLGIKCWEFPGHTRGHVHYYSAAYGGALFTGDTAVGAPIGRAQIGKDEMSRAPFHLNEDDAEVARRWEAFLQGHERPAVSTICPYHGKAYGNESPMRVDFLLTPLKSPWPKVLP